MSDWLQVELAEQLRPVQAPDELWDRVSGTTRKPAARTTWPVAAIITILIAAGTLFWVARGQQLPSRAFGTVGHVHAECMSCHRSL